MRWALTAGVTVLALGSSAAAGSSGLGVLAAMARLTAILLLVVVSLAAAEVGHRWLTVTRHDSIRADIAAGGGLGKRLSL